MATGEDADATRSTPPAVVASASAAARTVAPIERGMTFVDEPETYSIDGAIGAGGMGQVLAAKGSHLGRAVALKVVTVDREDLRRRFEREAQVTARLQHPNIVPVYGAGRRDGQPFYAMKHVTGDPLDKVIAREPTLAKRIALLPNVIAVTEAIAYAHAENVIHRDLKPANVLVGKFGETVVIDWGLAKDLARTADEADAALDDAVSPFRESSGGLADATVAGRVMGTPSYMPVEQARGEAVDARADVYALGAMLYHVLAGKAPYARDDEGGVPWETMLARVLAGPPTPLAERAPDASPELVAIVTRAMARSKADRYASAGQLAEDLRRFEMGQLVGAHRYSTWQLVRRWLRKHRGAVTVGAVFVVVLAVVSVVSVQRIRRERSDAEAARATAEEQRGLAVASRNDAEDLIGFMLGDLKDKLQPVGKLDILDPVVAKTIAYYDKRPADADDADERAKRAQAFANVGDVRQPEGNLTGALEAYRKALALREPLAAPPTAYAAQGALADTHLDIGDVLNAQGDGSGALVEYKTGLAIADKAAAGAPADDTIADTVATARIDIGDVERAHAQPDAAVADYEAAVAIRGAVVKRSPSLRTQRELASSYTSLAGGDYIKGDLGAALAAIHSAIATTDKLASADPKDMRLQRDLGFEHHRAADILLAQSKFADALAEAKTASAIDEALVARDPTNSAWLRDLETTYGTLARAAVVTGDGASAVATARLGVATAERLTKLDPANNDWRVDLAKQHQFVAMLLRRGKDLDGAIAEIALAREGIEKLAAADPTNPTYQSELATCHNIAGNTLASVDDPVKVRAGIVEYEAAAAIFKKLVASAPDSISFQRQYADTVENIADNLAGLDDAKAKALYAELVPRYEQLIAKVPSDNSSRESLIIIHLNLGDFAAKTDAATARAEYEKAVAVGKELHAADATNARWNQLADKAAKRLAECCKK